jgi:hypothetical protein
MFFFGVLIFHFGPLLITKGPISGRTGFVQNGYRLLRD